MVIFMILLKTLVKASYQDGVDDEFVIPAACKGEK